MSITESTEECVFAFLREECEIHTILSREYLKYWNAYYLDNDWNSIKRVSIAVNWNDTYFKYPPHVEIARRLDYWKENGSIPSFTGSVVGYKNMECPCSFIGDIKDAVLSLLRRQEIPWKQTIYAVIRLLGEHGLQHLLGMRHTVGSSWILYPSRDLLLGLFEKKHHPRSQLTVGARALSKHSIRCKGAWGELRGPECVQNEIARSTLLRIMEHCVWINIHLLPHDVTALEIRVEDGFGARWDLTNSLFRGFVEPYMENGFAVHWIHDSSRVCSQTSHFWSLNARFLLSLYFSLFSFC